MSERIERTFFNLRFAVPGYTFILVFFLINLKVILKFISTNGLSNSSSALLGVFLGFVALLGGGAMGFLVSQFWYFISQRWKIQGFYGTEKHRGPFRTLIDYCDMSDKKEDEKILLTVYDYIIHSLLKPSELTDRPKKGIYLYMSRRWDLMNLLGSTAMAIVLSSVIGYVIRGIARNFVSWHVYEYLVLGFF